MRLYLPDEQHTHSLGRWLASRVSGGHVLSLEGPLGAGKTTLLQGLAQGLGIPARLTSPTFIVFRVLPVTQSVNPGSGIAQLVHADAYRIKNPAELVATGFTEYVGRPDTLTVVEWGDRVKKLLPQDTLQIKLTRGSAKKSTRSGRQVDLPAALGKPPKDWYKN
ncbi:MAG: tRNA (adenosine(37)-N6)-threonylcarbamoyltransferase complex ATPase subunit type 1 TsaE [Candidatus Andersenbacteria bacterium]